MALHPKVVAFDLVETIASLEPVAKRLREAGVTPDFLPLWFTRIMQDGFALTLCEESHPFGTVAGETLAVLLHYAGVVATPEVVQDILAGFADSPRSRICCRHCDCCRTPGCVRSCWPTAARRPKAASSSTMGYRSCSSVWCQSDDAVRWKPHPAAYRYTCKIMHVPPTQMALVTAHGWDILGAGHAGWSTGLINRQCASPSTAIGQPTVCGAALSEVVKALLALP